MTFQTLRGVLLASGLTLALSAPVFAQTAGQDMHAAGHDTKQAAVNTGHATSHVTRKAYHKTKHGTKKAWHKTENLGDRVADKPQTH